jgi:hypothetical protein
MRHELWKDHRTQLMRTSFPTLRQLINRPKWDPQDYTTAQIQRALRLRSWDLCGNISLTSTPNNCYSDHCEFTAKLYTTIIIVLHVK